MSTDSPSTSHAVVIGAGMAGLLAARVLSEHVDRVTLVERDCLPSAPHARKGAPQARHIHVLLVCGRSIFERFFPGFARGLAEAGVQSMDVANDFAWLTPAGWSPRFDSGLRVLACSRDWLEWVVRQQVMASARVHVRDRTEVTDLMPNSGCTAIAGVAIRRCEGPDGRETPLPADLVVDASGRGSKVPEWLGRLGYDAPEETVVSASLGYSSRLYRRPLAISHAWQCVYLQAAPPGRTRAGVVFPIEDGRWIVTIAGGGGDYPPTDEAGFVDFMRSLPSPILYDAVRHAEPLTPIYGYRATQNRWRHYERLRSRPEGLLVLGDAACTFNPVYGQGMTTAALGAHALRGWLQDHSRHRAGAGGDCSGMARRFQRSLAKVNAAPWLLATSEDFRYPGVEGTPPTRGSRLMHRYLDRLTARSTHDQHLRRVLLEVLHLTRPPAALLRPGIIGRFMLG